MRRVSTAALAALVFAGQQGPAQPPLPAHPRGYVAYRATSPIAIDGRLDDGGWQAVPWSDTFVDIEGNARPTPPRFATRVKMLWDQVYFYIGAELVEPHLWATLQEHDSVIFHDNDFEVFIDPNGDNHEYYELEINALNTTWDLLLPKPYKDDGKAVNGWEIAGLKTAVHLDGTLNNPRDTDRGWTVELALPWKALGELARRPSPPRDGDQWRVNFSRVEWQIDPAGSGYQKRTGTQEANWVWSPQGVIDMHRPERWGYVYFSTGKPGSISFDSGLLDEQAVRDFLHAMYYAEKEYRRVHGRWATTFAELGLIDPVREFSPFLNKPSLSVAGDQFEVSVTRVLDEVGKVERWHIRQDSLLWKE